MADRRRSGLEGLDPTVRQLVGEKRGRKKARYPSEENRVKGTWDLRPETLERIRALAEELGVAQYSLVEKALTDWLDLYEAGEVEIRKVPVVTTWGVE
jgi:hypothetical protein